MLSDFIAFANMDPMGLIPLVFSRADCREEKRDEEGEEREKLILYIRCYVCR
jgi:hypothetical protein